MRNYRLNEELEKELNALKSDEDERISMQEHQHVIEQLHSEKQQLSRVIVQNKQMKEKFEDLNLQVENLVGCSKCLNCSFQFI